MKQVLFSIAVFCALFFNSNLSTLLGFQNNVTTVAFLPITLFLFSQIVKKQIFFFRKRNIPYSGRKLDKQHRRVSWDCRSSKIHSGKPRQPSHHLLRQHHRYNMVQEYENCLFKALSSVT